MFVPSFKNAMALREDGNFNIFFAPGTGNDILKGLIYRFVVMTLLFLSK